MAESDEPFDRWHKKYPKAGDMPCRCGTKRTPLYPSADHGRGGQWQARYTDPQGKPRRPAFATWEEARDTLEKMRVDMRGDEWVDPDLGKKKVEFYANQFIERRKKKNKNPRTTETYESHIRNHIIPFAGRRVAKTLKRKVTMNFVDYLIDKPGPDAASTVVAIFKTWRILMNYMIDEDVPIPGNICSRIDLPEVDSRVTVPLSPQNVAALAAAVRSVEPRYEVLVWIAACAGFREGEAFGLRATAVEWDSDLLYLVEQRQRGKVADLKTKTSKATLPVDHFLIERLVDHCSTFPQADPVSAHSEAARRRRGYVPPEDEGLIVTNRFGRPVQRSDFNKKWAKAVQLAGLPKGTRFHDLKHFYTTQLGASGQHDPKTVQALSRHADFAETWDTYAHPPIAVEGVTVNAFRTLFAETSPVALVPQQRAGVAKRGRRAAA
ncbi:integrase [Streptacidiphilus sp. MAP12-20]|uniref:tyrosine-type recombinase/integrase n=1 Tax=Streptacidiphilus sp. MAP12-20 TaxID=3156299 RepID=UPI003511A241